MITFVPNVFFGERAAYFLGFDKEKEKVFLGFF
jgi:hypothetical protein